jgi:four helix bundle protein
MDIEDLKVYSLAMDLGEKVWSVVDVWNYFQKDTVGKQLVKAADSIAANLSEVYGRYHYREAKNFGYYSRGSLYETRTWLTKAVKRKLISEEDYRKLCDDLLIHCKNVDSYIRSIENVSERPDPSYNH